MGARLLAVRPEPGLCATIRMARAMGLDCAGHALSEIRPVSWVPPDPASIDALLIGSANAILHGGDNLAGFRTKPVYAVGAATAMAAREAGFAIAATGSGGLQNVLDAIPAPNHLLRIAGAEHVPLTAPKGIVITTAIAYRSAPLPLDPAVPTLVADKALVMLHSAASAAHFASECDRLALDRGRITLAALGPRIAKAAGEGWAALHVAPRPTDRHLLEMLRDLCE